jgi:hypothetical protein
MCKVFAGLMCNRVLIKHDSLMARVDEGLRLQRRAAVDCDRLDVTGYSGAVSIVAVTSNQDHVTAVQDLLGSPWRGSSRRPLQRRPRRQRPTATRSPPHSRATWTTTRSPRRGPGSALSAEVVTGNGLLHDGCLARSRRRISSRSRHRSGRQHSLHPSK